MAQKREEIFYPVQQVFDNFYNNFFSGTITPSDIKGKSGFPKWDIYQTKESFIVEIAATGCGPEDISVEILPVTGDHDRTLKVSGRISEENQLGDGTAIIFRELRRSNFERSLYLPKDILGDPEATMKNGILKLSWKLPKPAQSKIAISAS